MHCFCFFLPTKTKFPCRCCIFSKTFFYFGKEPRQWQENFMTSFTILWKKLFVWPYLLLFSLEKVLFLVPKYCKGPLKMYVLVEEGKAGKWGNGGHWKVNKNEQGEGDPSMCVRSLFKKKIMLRFSKWSFIVILQFFL